MYIDKQNSSDRYNSQLSHCAAVIATNSQLHDVAEKVNGTVSLIPNGVDLELFNPVSQREDRLFTVGFAGNIWGCGADYKGWSHYVAAVLPLIGEVRRKECLFKGPAKQAHIEHEQMPAEFFQKIDCLILPSLNEGCSNVITEALASGVPVLCTKVGYHGERLTDGENVVFIDRDPQDIGNKIMMLKQSPELQARLRENGRKFVEKFQDINSVAQQYDAVIQAVIDLKTA